MHPSVKSCRPKEKDKAAINGLSLNGKSADGSFRLGYLSKMQALLANLYYNKTEIILDLK